MKTEILSKNFEEIYNKTYKEILKYVISHCNNLEDVNDIVQETYVEFYKQLKKNKKCNIIDEKAFIIGISKNVLKKYYRFKYKERDNIEIFENEEIQIEDDIDIEMEFITKENIFNIWQILKNKSIEIAKIFYLFYGLDMKITDIAKELNLTESATKNHIYRTIKELKNNLKEDNKDA